MTHSGKSTVRALSRTVRLVKSAAKPLVMPILALRFHRQIGDFTAPYKLHLGCGSHHLEGWVNIDFIRTPAVDVWWNLSQPLPLPNNTCKYIYHEHVLEHFEISKGLELLAECYRLLQNDGILRVAMPSLDVILANCANGEWRADTGAHMPKVETVGEYLNVIFRSWGHKWIYDKAELHRRLQQVGFREITDLQIQKSTIPELANIEHRKDSFLICEAKKKS